MKCATCRKLIGSSDRRRKYCSPHCRANAPVRPKLRAVDPGETATGLKVPEPRQMAVDRAAREGSDLELLMAMRDRVAETVSDPTCPPRDLAALTRRLEEIRRQISAERQRLAEESADAADIPDEAIDAASF